jgi:hypothetical protein
MNPVLGALLFLQGCKTVVNPLILKHSMSMFDALCDGFTYHHIKYFTSADFYSKARNSKLLIVMVIRRKAVCNRSSNFTLKT